GFGWPGAPNKPAGKGMETMKFKTQLLTATIAAATMSWGAAQAVPVPVTATLSATYYEVADGSDPDFNLFSTPTVANGSALGAHGAPVATGGVNDIDPTSHELTWWTPSLN